MSYCDEARYEFHPRVIDVIRPRVLGRFRDLLHAKRELPSRLVDILPEEVVCNELLMNFLMGLISPDPNRRFPSAEAAEHVDKGAAAFHRQLIMSDMATEYDNDIRVWLEELRRLENE